MKLENTCPKCGSELVQRLETYEYEDELVVLTKCDKCEHLFDQHYKKEYMYTDEERKTIL